jgi:hypothetical protein
MLEPGSLLRSYSGMGSPLLRRTNTEEMCREY